MSSKARALIKRAKSDNDSKKEKKGFGSMLWEKKPQEVGISDADKKDALGRLEKFHDETMKRQIPVGAEHAANGLHIFDDTSPADRARKEIGLKLTGGNKFVRLQDYYMIGEGKTWGDPKSKHEFKITGDHGEYLEKTIDRLNSGRKKFKKYNEDFEKMTTHEYHLRDIADEHAAKAVNTPKGDTLPFPKFDDHGALAAIDADRAVINKSNMWRNVRNGGRVGLGLGGLAGGIAYLNRGNKNLQKDI